jgi:sugar transferase EpsL
VTGAGATASLRLKRAVDCTVSGFVLLMAAPVMALVALMVCMDVGSPVLFRQRRPGLNGELFDMVKFRTMRDLRDAAGMPLANDRRLTRFGRLLRSTSLDELPELWNVLKGEMSLVGPRPLLVEYLPLYTAEQRRRHEVKPGITGWAQINGRNTVSWEDRFRMDVWYVDNRTTWLDLRILFRTVFKVLARSGISQPGNATIERFKASK